jgi:hypothetical protein
MNENENSPTSLGTSFDPFNRPARTHAAPELADSATALPTSPARTKATQADARMLALPPLSEITWMRIQVFDNRGTGSRGMSQFSVKMDYCVGKVNTYRPDGKVYISMVPSNKIKAHAKKHFPDAETAADFYEPLLEMRKENPEIRAGFVQVKSPRLSMGTVTFTDQYAVMQLFKAKNADGEEVEHAQLILSISGAEPLIFVMEPKDRCTQGASKYLAYYDPNDYNTERKQHVDD